MPIPKNYDPSNIEGKWYQTWLDNKLFSSTPDDREPYTIVIPPPNVTGVLHMGHLLNNTLQDVLIRRARMQGKNACWVPGTDHASIATEAKVVKMLREEKGIDKNELSREEFLKYAWEWREKYGGIILQQLKKIGASCDWDRTRFTMEDKLYRSVIKVFVDLYNQGYIYKGEHMVNWDVEAKTALSNEEVNHQEINGTLYYIKYRISGTKDHLTIATTRPETILGDTAIIVHPNDQRYHHLKGKKAVVPIIEREVPIIEDDYVDPEFGTGALKVTPAHDPNDHELGEKHHLQTIDIFNNDGTLNKKAGAFIGSNRFKARDQIVKKLKETGQLDREENLTHSVGFSERTDTPIEPRISTQWFCKMEEMASPALENVMNGNIRFFPEKIKNIYRHWIENIQEWCISRQLWWGQRIPAYYLNDDQYVVAETRKDAVEIARKKFNRPDLQPEDLRQDEDVLDTWFSSWLWPITVFDGITHPGNKEINYYYPTTVLVTAQDIIFFWVARMIMSGYNFKNEKPFHEVYFTGMVRDARGRKMSKSLGNSPDILKLIDDYGADAVRFGVLISSPAGNDLLFEEKLIHQGRNFCNKIWNALRLVKSWEQKGLVKDGTTGKRHRKSIELFENKFASTFSKLEKNYTQYRISENLKIIYTLIREDFCSKYLEWIKPLKGENIDQFTYSKTLELFESLLKLLHPFMPFITEEIRTYMQKYKINDLLTTSPYPETQKFDPDLLDHFNRIAQLITGLRNFKASHEISHKEPIQLKIKAGEAWFYEEYQEILKAAANIEKLETTGDLEKNIPVIVMGKDEIQVKHRESFDPALQIDKLNKELEYTLGFLQKVMKKLENEGFVNNARPEIVEKERKKKRDAEEKIKKLKANLSRLQQTSE